MTNMKIVEMGEARPGSVQRIIEWFEEEAEHRENESQGGWLSPHVDISTTCLGENVEMFPDHAMTATDHWF